MKKNTKKKGVAFLEEINKTGVEFQKKFNAEVYLAQRRAEAAALVLEFNTTHRNSLVYLKLVGNDNGAFQIHLRLNDVFVEQKYYDEGSACIYTSETLYKEIQRIAGARVINWNNTGSIGWLSFAQ